MKHILRDKSKAFAIRIVRLSQYLQENFHEYVLSRQVLKSGTSIGANIRESKNAQSISDFISKLEIALKESDETEYWLEILHETGYISDDEFDSVVTDNKELTAMLVSIVKSSKKKREIENNSNNIN
ncbi:MAG: four helix bundle protein [Bacteroidaceae bacterium]|nr:four helix bundle protein [Bacteroidaceae bacterium]MBQ4462188.1 four helix bundle protein [Bacteroidaceae bacterium]MBQ7482680.1 four helix bundle protein [Bacteroidaceae bacterium]MCR4699482.1 four helix bundle protein [Bacteroidaceae bacterium]